MRLTLGIVCFGTVLALGIGCGSKTATNSNGPKTSSTIDPWSISSAPKGGPSPSASHAVAAATPADAGAPVKKKKLSRCVGVAFDAEIRDARCIIPYDELDPPPPNSLSYQLTDPPAVVKSGGSATIEVEIKNISNAPVAISLDGPGGFTAEAVNAKGSSLEAFCSFVYAPPKDMFQVTLTPGGTVRRKFDFEAIRRRIGSKKGPCVEAREGSIAPGEYSLRVRLPWGDKNPDPDADEAERIVPRYFDVPITVTK